MGRKLPQSIGPARIVLIDDIGNMRRMFEVDHFSLTSPGPKWDGMLTIHRGNRSYVIKIIENEFRIEDARFQRMEVFLK